MKNHLCFAQVKKRQHVLGAHMHTPYLISASLACLFVSKCFGDSQWNESGRSRCFACCVLVLWWWVGLALAVRVMPRPDQLPRLLLRLVCSVCLPPCNCSCSCFSFCCCCYSLNFPVCCCCFCWMPQEVCELGCGGGGRGGGYYP